MMDTGEDLWITVSEFRTHMSRILREVEHGKTFTVIRRGRVVARVVRFAPHSTAASIERRREAGLIREGTEAVTARHRTAEPRIPLFKSGIPDLASRVDDYLEGFGEDR